MKFTSATAVLLLTLSFVISNPLLAEEKKASSDWRTLFNGKDLTGWRPNRDPAAYKIVDGTLRLQASAPYSHLFYVGDKKEGLEIFKNFELELTARAEANSNSGVYFHTSMAAAGKRLTLTEGYEVQLNCAEKEKRKTGSLYGVVDLPESAVDESKWFTMRIKVVGKHILVYINDKKIIDYTETDENLKTRKKNQVGRKINPKGGAIALQAHDPNSVWYFKAIRVRRLPD